jgi:hypothetical protein
MLMLLAGPLRYHCREHHCHQQRESANRPRALNFTDGGRFSSAAEIMTMKIVAAGAVSAWTICYKRVENPEKGIMLI